LRKKKKTIKRQQGEVHLRCGVVDSFLSRGRVIDCFDGIYQG